MELLICIAAATVAFVVRALWAMAMRSPLERALGAPVSNRGYPFSQSPLPYLLAGACLMGMAVMMRGMFLRYGIDTLAEGFGIGDATYVAGHSLGEYSALCAAGALTLISDGEENALGFLGEAVRALNASARYDEASATLQQELRAALDSLQAVSGELRAVAEDGAADPEQLAQVEGRLGALGKLRTKYGPTLEDVLEFQAGVEGELAALTRDEQDAGTLDADVEALFSELQSVGAKLDAARRERAAPLAANVLLVPHHGSKTSSSAAFLDAVQPRTALVQAAYRSRFGHPAPEVVQRYRERGVQVVDSARCGAARWHSERPGEVLCERQENPRYWQHRMAP